MEALINSFRRSRHVQKPSHLILSIEGVSDKEKANELVGKKVSWKTPADNVISGKIAAAHGNSGCVRAVMEKGMPGQSLGTKVNIE